MREQGEKGKPTVEGCCGFLGLREESMMSSFADSLRAAVEARRELVDQILVYIAIVAFIFLVFFLDRVLSMGILSYPLDK